MRNPDTVHTFTHHHQDVQHDCDQQQQIEQFSGRSLRFKDDFIQAVSSGNGFVTFLGADFRQSHGLLPAV